MAYQPRHFDGGVSRPRNKKSASGSPLLHILFLPLMVLYLELVLFFWVNPGFNVTLWYLTVFSLSAGGVLWLLCSLFSER